MLKVEPWKKTPNGYETRANGQKVTLEKQGKDWVVLIGKTKYDLKAKKPQFGHAEGIIKHHFEKSAARIVFRYRLAKAVARSRPAFGVRTARGQLEDIFPTLWYENEKGDRWIPDFKKGFFMEPPEGFIYQWSRSPLSLHERCLKITQASEVEACPHPEDDIRKTYGWIDGIEGRECALCGGSQKRLGDTPWPDKWEAYGSKTIFHGEATYSADMAISLARPSPEELARIASRGLRAPVIFDLKDAIILAGSSCERCMNALAYRYGLDWGYARGSEEWERAGTSCFVCKKPETWEWLEKGQ